jgi:O-antigen/teichoic acid export membrane protein
VLRLAGWLAAASAVQLLLGLAKSALLARWLGPDGFGRLGFVLDVVALAEMLAPLGLGWIVTREIAARPARAGLVLGSAVRLRLVLSMPLAAVAWWAGGPWAAVLLVANGGQLGTAALRGLGAQAAQVASSLLVAAATLVAAVACLPAAPSPGLALAALAAATLVGASGQLALAASAVRRRSRRAFAALREFSRPVASSLWRAAVPLWLGGLFVGLVYRLDVLMLRWLLPRGAWEAQVGWYKVAYALKESGDLVLGGLVVAAFPAFSTLTRSRVSLAAAYDRAARAGWWAGLAACVLAWWLGGPAVRLLYGPDYAPAIRGLAWLAPALALVLQNSLASSLLVAVGRQREIAWVGGAMAAANAILNLWTIPRHGFVGAAAATTLTEGLGFLLLRWRLVQSSR